MSWRTQSRGRGQPFGQNRQLPESPSFRGGRGRGGRGFVRVDATHRSLDFIGLQKLADDSTEPADVIRKFNSKDYGLGAFLDDHKADFDYLEFVFVVLGKFCRKNGPTQFTDGFVEIVRVLGEREVFQQVASVVMHLPNSRALTSSTKSERLNQLITGVYHLSVETLVLMPSFACTFLGRNFYQDLLILKDMPSIKALNLEQPVFDVLLEGVPRLEDAWNQHNVVDKKQNEEEAQYEERVRRQVRDELVKLQKPPNDFRKMSVMPSWEDFLMEEQPFLRPNIVEGQYPDAETYLDVQFRLTREDFVQPLRTGIQEYMKQAGRKQQRFRVDNLKFYYDVTISEQDAKRNQYTLKFSLDGLAGINWEGSKRLMAGSLLCLTPDGFNTITFFTVAFRDVRQLSEGKILTNYEGGPLPGRRSCQTFLMAESSVYFEAYRSVLMALQRISPVHLPLADYLLGKFNKSAQPDYLVDQEPIYDLSSVPTVLTYTKTISEVEDPNPEEDLVVEDVPRVKDPKLENIDLRKIEEFPSIQDLNLDESQREALLTALTRKVAVIQGPPGTGKTYLGLKIVQVLLDNRKYWNRPDEEEQRMIRLWGGDARPVPILVICYTNHALDQFLEGIMAFTRKIVRIGGQSKCKALDPFMLKEWSKRTGYYGCRGWIREVRDKLDAVDRELCALQELCKTVDKFGIVHEDYLLKLKILPPNFHAKLMNWKRSRRQVPNGFSALATWLGVYPYGATDSRLGLVAKNLNQRPAVQPKMSAAVRQERVDADDQWEREDVEAIQGERVVVGDDYDDVPRAAKAPEEMKSPDLGLNFAITVSQLIADQRELEENLASAGPGDQEFFNYKLNELRYQAGIISRLLDAVPPLNAAQLRDVCNGNLDAVPLANRWAAYNAWKGQLLDKLGQKERKLEADFRACKNELAEVRTKESAEICRPADIVGFTTSGAAKQRALIGHLKPQIVIVEEAAQVLEAHVVTALSTSCQHLILIGDHQQLKPPTTVYQLAKDYNLDVSLFERLIRNGMDPSVLGVQHRMRPEVARLIVPSIYPKLDNHESVLQYPEVRGMDKSVFFLAHNQMEKSDYDGRSHSNPYEAELALALVRHFVLQGYGANEITILTTYSGQLLHLRKLRNQQASFPRGVRIAVVDNFQGEENEIVVLSLVRSNESENIGFLRIENRICVALSRAKQGFYLIGNMDALQGRSKLWNKISGVLDNNGEIGTHFPLKCQVHGDVMSANKPEEFPPEGGCFKKCKTEMPCGHVCPQLCHSFDRQHVEFKCRENCLRSCSVGHPCPKRCFADCNPCRTKVVKRLPCGHEQQVQCHEDVAKVFCTTRVWKDLPFCGHLMELCCGADPRTATCPDVCGMTMECGHICPLPCHKRSSHQFVQCNQPCIRTCPEDHPCPKKCWEDCGNCFVVMDKKLPCDHVKALRCFVKVEDAFCPVPVEKILPCQHKKELKCSEDINVKCYEICDKIICNDEHRCKKKCFEPCNPCHLKVDRMLGCGHTQKALCRIPTEEIVCRESKKCTFPDCGHKGKILCGMKVEQAKCTHPCDRRMDCGHLCTLKCHLKTDPDHEKYKCMKQCESDNKNCHRNHRCGRKCYEECQLCPVNWKRKLTCGHLLVLSCHLSDEDAQSHCKVNVRKTIPECGHSINVQCGYKPTRADCKERCSLKLECGHDCVKKCCDPCTSADCTAPVRLDSANFCGHPITLPCQEVGESDVSSDEVKKALLLECNEECTAILECEHPCRGTCGSCFSGRFHVPCEQKCGRILVCGHSCKVNCATSCPPCAEKCDNRCQHSKCTRKCSEPCVPCKEPCGWSCDHYKCSRRCCEPCDRPRCDLPCSKKIDKCGHPCVGLCGELCPPLCRVCDFAELTEFALSMTEEDPDARFVFLPDCGHTIEVSALDTWMLMENEENGIRRKCCPRCQTLINCCLRYGDVIKKNFEDIVLVKKKIFDMRQHPQEFARTIEAEIRQLEDFGLNGKKIWWSTLKHPIKSSITGTLLRFNQLVTPSKDKSRHQSLDGDQRYKIQVTLDVIDRMCKLISKISTRSVPDPARSGITRILHLSIAKNTDTMYRPFELEAEHIKDLLDQLQTIFTSFYGRNRICSQEYQDFIHELERLDLIRAYYLLLCSPCYSPGHPSAPKLAVIKRNLMEDVTKLDDSRKTETVKLLEEAAEMLKSSLGINKEEKEQILKAMGMRQGHWFKCPNGHVYVIGDCGGATVESTCNECGAKIGGGSHRLRHDNQLASEMDGATRGAWPGSLH